MIRFAIRAVSLFLFSILSLPCLFFGWLGLAGQLSDTSLRENVEQGLTFLGLWFLTLLPALLTLVSWKGVYRGSVRELTRFKNQLLTRVSWKGLDRPKTQPGRRRNGLRHGRE
jgi:hypothetical protein